MFTSWNVCFSREDGHYADRHTNIIIHCDRCYEEKVQGAVTVKQGGEGVEESEKGLFEEEVLKAEI